MARKENTQHPCLYKLLDSTPKSSSALLSDTAVLLPHPSWKPSLVSRAVLQSHLFLPVKPAHSVALPIPAVLVEYPISHLLMAHHDLSHINIVAGLVLIISVLAGGTAIETALQVVHSISFTNFTEIHPCLNDKFIGTTSAVKESYCGHGRDAFSHHTLQCQTRAELRLKSLSKKSPSCLTRTGWLKSLPA